MSPSVFSRTYLLRRLAVRRTKVIAASPFRDRMRMNPETRSDPPRPLGGEGRGERLSGLSSGKSELPADVAGFCIEPHKELTGQCNADHQFGFSGLAQP